MRLEDDMLAKATTTPFALWLRTGRWVPAQIDDPALEVKFNPNHDPKDGRFTSGPGGASADRERRLIRTNQAMTFATRAITKRIR